MEAKDYLAYIVNEIHTTIVATVDDEGLPITAAIDMMDSDESSLYFLTANGKGFYDRLKKRGFLALTAIKGHDTINDTSVVSFYQVIKRVVDQFTHCNASIYFCFLQKTVVLQKNISALFTQLSS